ncbi:MAG: hypothetical protein ACRDH2_01335 [Anaerolineales bacterium]
MPPTAPDEAILRTVLYADIFDYPLTSTEIHHYLIGASFPPETVQATLNASPWLRARVTRANGYVTVRDRETLGALRDERQRSSAALWPKARRWAYLTGCLPFVRLVAVTGALAVDNAPPGDDIDFLIVTAPERVWLTRAFAIGLVYLARRSGVGLCPNYVLSQSALAQEPRNLFIAHDLAQMVPLVGRAVYAEMRAANLWADDYLPHARRPLREEPELAPRGVLRVLKRLGEWLLSRRLGDVLEAWERRRKLHKFASAALQPKSAARLDNERVKGHFNDHGGRILHEFELRILRHYGSTDAAD